jgi:hypothetical protein
MRANTDRAETGRHLVNEYVQQVYGREASVDEEGDDSCIIDALTDILHYAVAGGHDHRTLVDWALRHVEVELEEGECEP